jgi:hypothetical protein
MDTSTHLNEQAEQQTLTMQAETFQSEQEQLAARGFTSEEIVSLLWLQKWYQTGGSDRVEMVRNWEFLKFLVVNGKLDV